MTASRTSTLFRIALFGIVATLTVALTIPDADARRLGGGKSFGRQSPGAMQQRTQLPPSREAVGQSGQQSAQAPQSAPAPVQQGRPPAGNRWLGPLAGLAAGLGLAALLSHFGLAGPLANMLGSLLMIGLLVLAVLFVWRMLRGSGSPRPRDGMGPAYAGANASVELERSALPEPQPAGGTAGPGSVAATLGSAATAALPARPPGVPADFDIDAFLRNAKIYFHRLQAAWDKKDLHDIQAFTTPEVFAELRLQIAEETGDNYTEVVTLNAVLLGIEESESDYLASVRFDGSIREASGQAPAAFQEIWNLGKRKDGSSGWLLGGIQQIA